MASLVFIWLLLTSFSPRQLLMGGRRAAARGMAALHPAKPRVRRLYLLPKLVAMVLYDIVRSSIAVVKIIFQDGPRERKVGLPTWTVY